MATADDIKHLYLSVRFELLKHFRRRRILITGVLAVLLPLIFYIVPPLLGQEYTDTANNFAARNLGFITLLIIISGAIFAGDSISGEFEKKTGLLLFPTPQRKTSIFAGKYIASVITTWLIVALFYLVTVMEIASIYGVSEIFVEVIQSFLIALLYSTSVVSVIFFFSSIMKRTITSTLIGFFFLMMILPIITSVLMVAGVDPWFVVTHSADLITDRLGGGGGFVHGGGQGPIEFTVFEPELYTGIGVMVTYAVILFLIGLVFANRKRIE